MASYHMTHYILQSHITRSQ